MLTCPLGWMACDSIIEFLLKEEVQVATEGSINAFSRGWIQLIARFNFFCQRVMLGQGCNPRWKTNGNCCHSHFFTLLSRVSCFSSKIVLDRYIEILKDKKSSACMLLKFLDAYVYWSSLHIHSIFSVHFQQMYNHLMLIDVVECFFVNCLFN